jgi:uncharacterized cupin superfamily protein
MSAYTVKNLKEVEDQAVKFGLSPDMESRFARDDLECERTGVSYQRLAPEAQQPFAHRHGQDEEVYIVLGGGGEMKLNGDVIQLRQWDAVRVAPDTVRAFAAGPEGLELLAFGTHHPDDAAMEPSTWG